MKKPDHTYLYTENGYDFMALHRKAMVFNPRNTGNPIIDEYLDTYSRENDSIPIYHAVLMAEIENSRNTETPILPVSYKMVLQEINMAWVELIHQMVFIEKAYDTFCAEFKDTIENIILYDSPNMKESMIYRYNRIGISIFHIAAKIWLFNIYHKTITSSEYADIKEITSKAIKNVLDCYQELELCINSKNSIVYMEDFTGTTLIDYLFSFIKDVEENRLL